MAPTREGWITVVGHRRGKRHVERHPLNVPLELARGHLEKLSELALRELAQDIAHEQSRRTPTPNEGVTP
jgi:hypothetical protein